MYVQNQKIDLPFFRERGVTLYIKREDVLHPLISGNKYRKLKYNLVEARESGKDTLLTFGGAYSNHIAAVACAGKEAGLGTLGVIRGEELERKWQENPTLALAHTHGMRFHFVSREAYRQKDSADFLDGLQRLFGDYHFLPEGGSNAMGVKGCEEILGNRDADFDYICCAVGTGATLAGLANSSGPGQQVLGFKALKGDFLERDIRTFARNRRWKLVNDFHFGGYAKVDRILVDFINGFKRETGIALDPVYTGKMLFGIFALVEQGTLPEGSRVLAIHTGGLQGIKGMNTLLKRKNLPLLDL